MKNINKLERITSIYNEWIPSDIAFIKEIHWSQNNLKIVSYFQLRDKIDSWPNFKEKFVELTINFENISNLKLNFNSSGLHFVSGFDIIDISNDGLENINFHIEDYENGSIEFFCEKIEIFSIEEPKLQF